MFLCRDGVLLYLLASQTKMMRLKPHPMKVLHERTLKGTFFGNYKPRTDLPSVVEKYMNKVS